MVIAKGESSPELTCNSQVFRIAHCPLRKKVGRKSITDPKSRNALWQRFPVGFILTSVYV